MSGNSQSNRRSAATLKLKYGEDYHRRIGAIGGRISRSGGFASMSPERLREASAKGGRLSRKKHKQEKQS